MRSLPNAALATGLRGESRGRRFCDGHRDVGKKREKSDELQVIREALRGSVFQRILSESVYKPALDPHFASHPKAFKSGNHTRAVDYREFAYR
jgi:hypothetical protein